MLFTRHFNPKLWCHNACLLRSGLEIYNLIYHICVISPYLFSCVHGQVYMCFISHQCYESSSKTKDNFAIQDIFFYQKASIVVNSPLFTNAASFNGTRCVGFPHQQSFWSENSEWLTCRNYESYYVGFFHDYTCKNAYFRTTFALFE